MFTIKHISGLYFIQHLTKQDNIFQDWKGYQFMNYENNNEKKNTNVYWNWFHQV